MSEKRQSAGDSAGPKNYLKSYFKCGFIEGQDRCPPECVICGEKQANDRIKPSKIKQCQETKSSLLTCSVHACACGYERTQLFLDTNTVGGIPRKRKICWEPPF